MYPNEMVSDGRFYGDSGESCLLHSTVFVYESTHFQKEHVIVLNVGP